jgi:hypothetical protein
MKTYNVKVVNKMAVGVWPRADVVLERDVSYNEMLKLENEWSAKGSYNVLVDKKRITCNADLPVRQPSLMF